MPSRYWSFLWWGGGGAEGLKNLPSVDYVRHYCYKRFLGGKGRGRGRGMGRGREYTDICRL